MSMYAMAETPVMAMTAAAVLTVRFS